MDPQVDLKYAPKNDLQLWAIRSALRTVHQGVSKCLSNIAVIENYEIGHQMVLDYQKILKTSSEQLSKISAPPKVKLNKHNIIHVQRNLFETYHNSNNVACNPYRQLETCSEFGLLHDATSHWATEINSFLQVVSDDGDILKVPYSVKKLSGGFREKSL